MALGRLAPATRRRPWRTATTTTTCQTRCPPSPHRISTHRRRRCSHCRISCLYRRQYNDYFIIFTTKAYFEIVVRIDGIYAIIYSILYYQSPEVKSRHAQVRQRKVLGECYPECARRIGDMTETNPTKILFLPIPVPIRLPTRLSGL